MLFLAAIIAVLLSGCSSDVSASRNASLWVITEQSTSDGMNLQAEIIAERMEAAYPGLTVQLDILPTEEGTREIYLKQLRTQIMSGNGPDVYLLPTGNVLTTDYSRYKVRTVVTTVVEPLFYDVTQAMYSGVFLDISRYYDADGQLGKDALKTEVMDAGVLGDSRYVIPLRFDMPVLLTGTMELENTRITDLVASALEQENTYMAIGLQLPDTLALFCQIFD